MRKLKELLQKNAELLNKVVLAMNSENGSFQDDVFWDMCTLEDVLPCNIMKAVSDVLNGYDLNQINKKDISRTFRLDREYFYYDGYGRLVSTDERDYSDLIDEIVDQIRDFPRNIFPQEVLEVLDDEEEVE